MYIIHINIHVYNLFIIHIIYVYICCNMDQESEIKLLLLYYYYYSVKKVIFQKMSPEDSSVLQGKVLNPLVFL